jgi:cytochrome c
MRTASVKYVLLFAVVAMAFSSAPAPSYAQEVAAGEGVFKSQCGICHSPQKARNLTGPSLFDVVGRPAGQITGFHYSAANKGSGLTWDAATLERYLTNPRATIPGTTMAYPGLKDDAKRASLIAYLTSLH